MTALQSEEVWRPNAFTVRRALLRRNGRVGLSRLTRHGGSAHAFLLPAEVDEAVAWVRDKASPEATLTWTAAELTAPGAQRINSSERATVPQKPDIVGYSYLVADLDPSQDVPLERYRELLAAFPDPPTMVVASGRGLHVYWQLSEPVSVERAAPVLADLVRYFGSDRATLDPQRQLRIPGTFNAKLDAQRSAVIEVDEPDRRYMLKALEMHVCALSPRPPAVLKTPRRSVVLADGDTSDWPERYRAEFDLAEELTRVTGQHPSAQGKWLCPVGGHDGDSPSLKIHRDNEQRAICFGNHPSDMGRPDGSRTTFDVLDLHAWEAGQTVEDFMHHQRRQRLDPFGAADTQEGGQVVPLAQGQPEELTAAGKGGADKGQQKLPPQSSKLLDLAFARYRFGQSLDGENYALAPDLPHLARLLRGNGDSLRAELAEAFAAQEGKAPSQAALTETMTVLQGKAMQAPPRRLGLRLHESVEADSSRIVLDLGRKDGQCVTVTPDGWGLDRRPAALFKRTPLTGEMPVPVPNGDVDHLRTLLNVTPGSWPLLLAWCVAALIPELSHPLLLATGEQGTGKTTSMRMLVELLDPSPAPLRSAPQNERDWAVTAANSYVVGIDNVSNISAWFSDSLCKAVTGDGVVSRSLYTDSDVSVLSFRRVVVLTSIDPGFLRGDLASRLVTVELEPISPERRLSERALRRTWEEAHPQVLGGLLDLLAQVLAVLPEVRRTLDTRSRMADFSEVLAAVDKVLGTDATKVYETARERLAADVVYGDPVAAAVLALVEKDHGFTGTAAELLRALTYFAPDPRPKTWPADATRLSGQLKRVTPGLRDVGVKVEMRRTGGGRRVTVGRLAGWETRP